MTNELPKPPKGLSESARTFWHDILNEYVIDDTGSLRILELAVRAYDRMESARRQVKRDGLMVDGPRGRRVEHPALKIERDARAQVLQSLKTLGVHVESLNETPGRPGGK